MKPYLLVLGNYIKLCWKKYICAYNIDYPSIVLLSNKLKIHMEKESLLKLGRNIVSDGYGSFVLTTGGTLSIGDHVYFNDGIMISCKSEITIDSGCRFGPGVKIFDNDHKYDSVSGVKASHVSKPIHIGANCWIAANAVILKGTVIGNNCVIGAGTIVSGEIPDGSIVTMSRELLINKIKDTNE